MSEFQQLYDSFSHLDRVDQARFLEGAIHDFLLRDPGVESHSDVCGGEPCIVRTRIPIWVLVQCRQLGLGDAEILRCYPTLRAEDLVNAWSYARQHQAEIDRQIQDNETA
jgi:uncharacterized protein (DUF433 family)